MDSKTTCRKIVNESSLDERGKNFWLERFDTFDAEGLDMFLEAFGNKEDAGFILNTVTSQTLQKLDALKDEDATKLQEILQEEHAMLKKSLTADNQ